MDLMISLFCLPNLPGGPEPAMPDVSTICELLVSYIILVFSRSPLLSIAFYTALKFLSNLRVLAKICFVEEWLLSIHLKKRLIYVLVTTDL